MRSAYMQCRWYSSVERVQATPRTTDITKTGHLFLTSLFTYVILYNIQSYPRYSKLSFYKTDTDNNKNIQCKRFLCEIKDRKGAFCPCQECCSVPSLDSNTISSNWPIVHPRWTPAHPSPPPRPVRIGERGKKQIANKSFCRVPGAEISKSTRSETARDVWFSLLLPPPFSGHSSAPAVYTCEPLSFLRGPFVGSLIDTLSFLSRLYRGSTLVLAFCKDKHLLCS